MPSGNYYCAAYCPTGQTIAAVCTGTLGVVFGAIFNEFATSWTGTDSVSLTAQGTRPAKERGNYFKGSTSTDHMEFTSMYLNVGFTVSAWVRVDAIGSNMSIFSKDNNAADPLVAFDAYITSGGTLSATLTDPTDLNTSEIKSGSTSISAQQWTFTAISVGIDLGAVTVFVNFRVNTNTDELSSQSTSGIYWIDNT